MYTQCNPAHACDLSCFSSISQQVPTLQVWQACITISTCSGFCFSVRLAEEQAGWLVRAL
jgi:hypothetical protein